MTGPAILCSLLAIHDRAPDGTCHDCGRDLTPGDPTCETTASWWGLAPRREEGA